MEKLINYIVNTVFNNKKIVEELIFGTGDIKNVDYLEYKNTPENKIKKIIESNWVHYLYENKELFFEIKEFVSRDEYEDKYKEDALILKLDNTLYKLGCGEHYGQVSEVELKTKMIPYLYFEKI